MSRMGRNIRARSREAKRKGIAALEFALMLPLWIVLLLGVVDGCYFLLINERLDRISYTITDIVTQYKTITQNDLNDITYAAGELMDPMPFDSEGYIIVSSVFQTATGPIIKWQYFSGAAQCVSRVGTVVGGPAVLPNNMTSLNTNDNVIITEVCYNFTPLFLMDATCDPISYSSTGLCFPATLYRAAVFKPRLCPLTNPPT